MIRVAVVDDQDLVRAGFVLLLRSSPGVEVVVRPATGWTLWLCVGARPPTSS
jgi:DNA-binding NarL/FixJ family response regulator